MKELLKDNEFDLLPLLVGDEGELAIDGLVIILVIELELIVFPIGGLDIGLAMVSGERVALMFTPLLGPKRP